MTSPDGRTAYQNTDVDILDITNPRQPKLITDLQLDTMFPLITQTLLGLVQVNRDEVQDRERSRPR